MKQSHISKLILFTAVLALLFSFTALADAFGPGYTGWHQQPDGTWKYYNQGQAVKNTTVTVDGVTYTFDADGIWIENAGAEENGTAAATETPAAEQTAPAQTDPGQAADAAALARGSVSQQYANRTNPFPQYPDVVEIDIANQHVFCYKNNVLMWDSYCVTGCVQDGHSTPEGVFQIQSKERSRYLQGPVDPATGKRKWKNWVDYWMPFHNGCGLHDASWRNKFAGTIYQYGGSHGCVNLPVAKTPELYDLVYVGMPVVVHP